MESDKYLQKLIREAIPLPDCPVKRDHAIAARIVLEKKLLAYIGDIKKQYEQPATTEPNY